MRHLKFGLLLLGMAVALCAQGATQDETLEAMRKASQFMMDTVSYRGGFVDKYTEDLSERWGEVPARETMVWVQDPGTVDVGQVMLEAHRVTRDPVFRGYAERAANALVAGQLPCGGWHYFIDFDPAGTQQWYKDVLSKAWGWEEFYHWSGNATFDDETTQGATRFLLDIYVATLDPKYLPPLEKALDFILEAQYPLGGWPQRYPLNQEHVFDGIPDYTSYYTFNDSVTSANIHLLWEAWQRLGDARYRESALRGMFFTMIAQLGQPQPGWAQQYDMNLRPAQARTYEPAAVAPGQTATNIRELMRYYQMTGDSRFLRGIPEAIDWLDRARLPEGHSEDRTHAQFVEVGTGRPLYAHREGASIEDGRYWVDYVPEDFPGHYGMQITVDVEALREEFERVKALSPAAAQATYRGRPTRTLPAVTAESIQAMMKSMDARGAWIEDLEVVDYTDWKFKPRRQFRGISVRTFLNNMRAMTAYIEALED